MAETQGLYSYDPVDVDTYTLPGLPTGPVQPGAPAPPLQLTGCVRATHRARPTGATRRRRPRKRTQRSATGAGAGAGAGASASTFTAPVSPTRDANPIPAGTATMNIVRRAIGQPSVHEDDPYAAQIIEGKEKAGAEDGGPETEGGDGGAPTSEALSAAMALRTGEDAIAFFARYGNSCPVKFVHLNRADTGDQFRPYNLVVVPQGETDVEYFTMSSKGVVHICPDKPSEFVSLSSWMRESTVFNVLTSMSFFKYYLVRKMFRTWRSNIRYNLYCQQRAKLRRCLFLAKPSFCRPLVEIWRLLSEVAKVELVEIRTAKPFEIHTFTDLQQLRRNEASKLFDAQIEKMREVVERVCQDVSKRARKSDGGEEGKDGSRPSRSEKSKSMLAVKQEQARRVRALKRAAQEKAMLGQFVRHVDYMVISTLAQLVIRSAEQVLEELVNPTTVRKTGLFETTVRFSDNGTETEFQPTCQAFQGMMRTLFENMVGMVSNLQRILYVRSFKSYVAGLVNDVPTVASIVRDSETFRDTVDAIQQKFAQDFEHAEQYAEIFEAVRPIQQFEANDDFEQFAQGPMNVNSIKKYMSRIQDWEKELDKMRVQNMIGVLHVESRKLKQSLLPITTNAMQRMKDVLNELASTKCRAMLTEYEARLKTLDVRPPKLKEFAGYVEKFHDLRDDDRRLTKEAVLVDEMYRLLNHFEVKISPEDMVQLDDLRACQSEYTEQNEKAVSYVEDKMPEMTRTLDMKILKLNEQLNSLTAQLSEGSFVDADAEPEVVLEELDATRQTLSQFDEYGKTYNKWQGLFNIPHYEFKSYKTAQDAFQLRHTLWSTMHDFHQKKLQWATEPLLKVDVEELSRDVQTKLKTSFVCDKKLSDAVTRKFKNEVQQFRTNVNCILELGNPNMKERHWEKLFTSLGQPWIPGNESFTLEELMSYGVFENKDLVSDTSGTASGEAQLEASLDKVREAWAALDFNLRNYRESKHVFILGGLDEVFMLLEDNQVTLQTMMGSRYITGVRDEVEEWDKKLSILSETLDEWVACQRNWMYLETIFCAEDIQKQLPAEAAKFQTVDKMWKDVMKKTSQNPRVIAAVEVPEGENPAGKLAMFQRCNKLLEEVQKSLEDYLETKRSAFPRFYFLSNDELLAILSQTRDVQAVQPHLSKCFDSMKSLDFGTEEDSIDMFGFISGEKEAVTFSTPLAAVGNVENWLGDVESMMRTTLYDISKACLAAYPSYEEARNRDEWLFGYPAQPIISVDQIMWSTNVERCIREVGNGDRDAMQRFLDYSIEQIETMVALVRGELTKLQRTLLGAMVVVDVHARDVVRSMIAKCVDRLESFEWTRQLRYYWDSEIDDCVVRQTNTRFVYGYEYLGNSMRLVITPLTDKCYMTLTGAMHLKFGGAPAGPAGTGKTETVKDLGKALARQCVVFNCSDGLDYKMMGRFFSGLAQAGAWSCFDEFNRIDIEVLSVIAQQILCIQQGLQANASHIDFEGKEIPLSQNFGVFITMNPGYAGRTELPDNLKALFRPVAMMVPDYRLIAEIILFSQGFADAFILSNKMSQLYKLASEQLSKQDHYDFGMRAVKSVLVAAGQLKRKEPEVDENILLIRAMRDSNVPKFLEHDLPLFRGILADLFPGVVVPFVDYGKLQVAIENQLRLHNLQLVPSFITKIIQVHETQLVRHGMMVVGEAGAGKSTNAEILAKALAQLYKDGVQDKDGFYKKVERVILNPKSVTMGELYGEFNPISSEWTDGLVANMVRTTQDHGNNRKWIMFDGPVDALWIENMNTVLDDNKMLCLANGERIRLPGNMHVMFEVMDLAVASPATVSRCGMVYMECVHVGLPPVVKTWQNTQVKNLLPKQSKRIGEMIIDHLPATMTFLDKECRELVPSVRLQLVESFLSLLTTLLTPENGVESRYRRKERVAPVAAATEEGKGEEKGEEKGGDALSDDVDDAEFELELEMGASEAPKGAMSDDDLTRVVNMAYIFAFVWSFGGNVDDASRPKFNNFALGMLGSLVPDEAAGADLYSFFVDVPSRTLKPWSAMTRTFSFNPKASYFEILVPTQDTTRYAYLLRTLLGANRSVLFNGDTGVGKSVIIADTLNSMAEGDDSAFVNASVVFSAQTKSRNLQEIFETKLDKKRKNLLGPPAGKKMVLFIDDLNMPALEVYGAQPPVELLRQVVDQKGFYDQAKLFFKAVAKTLFVAAAAPPGGGRNPITQRCTRHFHMVWLTALSKDSLECIFGSILGGFLGVEAPAFTEFAGPIVQASINIYDRVQAEMLPTPAKSHYTFNLRDLSKVFQGVLTTKKRLIPERDDLLRLWLHEEQRVFRDRLVDEADRTIFNEFCRAELQAQLDVSWDANDFKDVLIGSYLARDEKLYREIKRPEKLESLFDEYLEEYNVSFSNQMHLVFFADAIAHVSRICRVLGQPRGNALLVGVGGSGRQSLTRLASFVCDYQCISIEITRVYGTNEWHDDLKRVLMVAGIKATDVVFLFSDTQIVKESFLEDINNLLNAGDVPNLYAPDEMEQIINGVRPLVKAAGKIETRDNIFAHYVQLVREHMHIVLTFSPIGDSFRNRCRMFPSLVNCCTIDWFNAWPEEALFSVANSFLSKSGPELGITEVVAPLCNMCVKLHRGVEIMSDKFLEEFRRHNYTTPTSYLELIKLYTTMLREQREIVSGKAARYRGGLQKLHETNQMVAQMQQDLTKLQPVLKKAAEDTAALLVRLAADQKEADAAAEVAGRDEAAASKMAAEVQAIKDDCQADLDEALPAYYSALKALDQLDKKQIQEVKSFANPPRMVGVVMEAVCILHGKKAAWDEGKKLLNDMKFLDNLKTYDKDNIKPKYIRLLKPYMKMEDFTPEKIKSVSQAATSLCMWVHAMVKYDKVAKTIVPKRERLENAEKKLAGVMAELAEKQAALKKIQDRVAELKASYEASLKKRDDLEDQKNATTLRLERATKLTDGLGDEAVRWSAAADQLEIDLQNLVGNIILAAGCVAYIGPFTSEYRTRLATNWVAECKSLQIPVADQFELTRILADPVTVREWQILGLPADDFSTENGLFATLGRRWPLMIDPQGQANRWVKNMQKDNQLQVIKLSESDFLRTLENAIRFGQPVLLENVEEELDPALEPVLLKQTFKKNGQVLLHLGDSDIPYSEDFKLFITTKLANPHYLPEVCIKVTVINFTVTMSGLEDQLLVDVVRYERPDLEQKKDQLIVSIASDKKQLKDVEDKILYMLANSSGDILEDEALINNLAASKRTSQTISARMKEAEATTAEIQNARNFYRPVATRGSILYFVIADMANVDTMYQYSLAAFSRLYNMRIEKSQASDDLDERINILINDLTWSFYVNMCRGLFEVHKLLYSFLIGARVMQQCGDITAAEMNYFLLGATTKEEDRDVQVPSAIKSWVSHKVYLQLIALDEVGGALSGIKDGICMEPDAWRTFASAAEVHKEPLPAPWQSRLSTFQRLMVIRALREEKVVFAVREFVGQQLGERFMEAPPFDLAGAYDDSSAQSPIIFVLSPGADPIDYLLKLAKEKGKDGPGLKVISLGQGQGPIAERMMEAARVSGDWVCLQNCHLSVSWLPKLEQILEQTSGTNEHEEYRLWLTSMPSDKFPVPILQNSIKLTQEPPRGLKANMSRTFADISEKEYESCSKPRAFKKLLFGLAFYHALILERRKFGAIGWNIPYEWMNSDLKTGIMQVRMYLEDQPGVPYETLNAVVGDITYGGRATDAWDKRTNLSILRKYFTEEVMDDSYKFSKSGVYFAPPEGDLAAQRDYVSHLPLHDEPETFGLHENADITLQQKETTELLKTLISIQPRAAGGGGGKSPDEIVNELADDIQSKLPAMFSKEDAHPATFARIADGSVNSLGVVCEQEMVRFNKLVAVMKKSLVMLKRAIKGLVVMSAGLERMHQCFMFQIVPEEWESAAYPSLKPLASWVTDLVARLDMIAQWLKHGPPPAFWISGFFFPQVRTRAGLCVLPW